jgi:hypothetical protein
MRDLRCEFHKDAVGNADCRRMKWLLASDQLADIWKEAVVDCFVLISWYFLWVLKTLADEQGRSCGGGVRPPRAEEPKGQQNRY